MNVPKKIKTTLIFVVVCLIVSTIISFASPGDNNDPLVTLSYITDVLLPDIDSRIEKEVETNVTEAMADVSNTSFVLVNVNANQKIIGDEGTEFVLRSGSGKIVATNQGGVADLTAGSDLPNGTDIPMNHHLLVPRSDSRGMVFTTDAIVLVKGTYTVSKK